MQKRRRPQSAVLHSFIQIKSWGEKLAVDGNEFCVISVAPDQNCLNYYENFQFKQKISVSNQKLFKSKILDVCVDANNKVLCVCENKKFIVVGHLCELLQQVCVPDCRFCETKQATQCVIQSNKSDDIYYVNLKGEKPDWKKLELPQNKQPDDNDLEVKNKILKFCPDEQDQNILKVFWRGENGEVFSTRLLPQGYTPAPQPQEGVSQNSNK